MSEFSIIRKYCQGIGASHAETNVSVGDDAAIVSIPVGHDLVVSVDTMVVDVHFFPDTSASLLARKLLSVNLSDMAAMGAQPKWATLALTLPNVKEDWLDEFSKSLHEHALENEVELIGGDTTQGPLTLSLQIMGLVEKGAALQRSNAKAGDEVFVSNTLGDAALALRLIKEGLSLEDAGLQSLRLALDDPQPQLALGKRLVGIASAAIDISDGLVADLSHIARASLVDIEVFTEQVPTSTRFQVAGGQIEDALFGGDDYQLAFCVPAEKVQNLFDLQQQLKINLTRVGRVVGPGDKVILMQHGSPIADPPSAGFQHFTK